MFFSIDNNIHYQLYYDKVILCRPIWMGKLIPPLPSFINKLVFVTCCGGSYEKKDEKFGHGFVFKEIEDILIDKCILYQAFPINLVLPDDKKEDPDANMKTRLNDENFKGEIQERFDNFIKMVIENKLLIVKTSYCNAISEKALFQAFNGLL